MFHLHPRHPLVDAFAHVPKINRRADISACFRNAVVHQVSGANRMEVGLGQTSVGLSVRPPPSARQPITQSHHITSPSRDQTPRPSRFDFVSGTNPTVPTRDADVRTGRAPSYLHRRPCGRPMGPRVLRAASPRGLDGPRLPAVPHRQLDRHVLVVFHREVTQIRCDMIWHGGMYVVPVVYIDSFLLGWDRLG